MHSLICIPLAVPSLKLSGFWDANLSWFCFQFLDLLVCDSFPWPTHNLISVPRMDGTENHCYMCSLGDSSVSTLFADGLLLFILQSWPLSQSSYSYPTDHWTSPPTCGTAILNSNVSKSELISNVPLFSAPPPPAPSKWSQKAGNQLWFLLLPRISSTPVCFTM